MDPVRAGAPHLASQAGALLLAVWATLAAVAVAAHGGQVPAATRSVFEGQPGWYAPADPESLAFARGRREARAVALPFEGGHPGLEPLARAAVSAIEGGEAGALRRLCVTEREFREILWPEFPQSRPATGATAADGWYFLVRRNEGGIRKTVLEHGGHPLVFIAVKAGAVTRYRNFRLHREVRIVVSDAVGVTDTLTVVRTVAERRGVFKIYSLRD